MTTILTATAATAIATLLEKQKATPFTDVSNINDDIVITDVTFTDKNGDIVKRMFLLGTPEVEEIESRHDLTLANIVVSGGSKTYENGAAVYVQLRTIESVKEELKDDYRVGILSRYNEKQVIKYFKKIMK